MMPSAVPILIAGWGRGRDNHLGYPTVNCQNAHVSCYAHAPFLQATDPRYGKARVLLSGGGWSGGF